MCTQPAILYRFYDIDGLQQKRFGRPFENQLFDGGGGGAGAGGGGGGLTLGMIGAGIAAAIGSNSAAPPSAANDSTYDNVIPLPPQSCPPDDGCKRAQDKLLNNRLLILGMWGHGVLGNMGEYRRLVTAFNQSVEAHNARCPAHPVAPLPLGPS
ncbi:hypothetical protein ACCC97_21255 [Variovorax sp. Varisp85]